MLHLFFYATCHKYNVQERVCAADNGLHDLLTGISNFGASKKPMSGLLIIRENHVLFIYSNCNILSMCLNLFRDFEKEWC